MTTIKQVKIKKVVIELQEDLSLQGLRSACVYNLHVTKGSTTQITGVGNDKEKALKKFDKEVKKY